MSVTAALIQSILNRYLQKYLKNVKTGESPMFVCAGRFFLSCNALSVAQSRVRTNGHFAYTRAL
jgi:hypothetical protein